MSKFTIMEYSFTKISGKTIGILVAAGLFFAGFSILYSWRQPLPQRRITPSALRTTTQTEAAPTHRQIIAENSSGLIDQAPPQPVEAVQEELQEELVIEEIAVSNSFFLVAVGNEQDGDFVSWEDAKTRLGLLAETHRAPESQKYVGPPIRLKIAFSPDLIRKPNQEILEEAHFRGWLSRVGDYIFARRMLLIGDLKDVIRNPDLMRASASDVDKRGCALFLQTEDEKWQVVIRGLEQHPQELQVVGEEIFLRALTEPSLMAACEPLKVNHISDVLLDMKLSLTSDQESLVDGYLDACTCSTAMKNLEITENLGAFLPLVAFSEIPSITEQERGFIEGLNTGFFNEFHQVFVINTIKKARANIKNLNALITNKGANDRYLMLVDRLRTWTEKTRLSALLLRSLFIERE